MTSKKVFSFIVGLVVFIVWMSIVGNPHVVETVLGLIISAVVGFWIYKKNTLNLKNSFNMSPKG